MTEGGQSAIIVFFTSEEIFFKKNTFAQILNAWAFLFETTKFLNEFVEQKKNNFKFFKFFKQSYWNSRKSVVWFIKNFIQF